MLIKKIRIPVKDILINRDNAQELIAGGGKKQVPCLRIEAQNGKVIWLYESLDIIQYLKTLLVDKPVNK